MASVVTSAGHAKLLSQVTGRMLEAATPVGIFYYIVSPYMQTDSRELKRMFLYLHPIRARYVI